MSETQISVLPSIKVTVITVCFNAAETIEKTIQSVCSQRDANIEYIVVDGASTDQTLDIVKSYAADIKRIISERDHGIYDAMNKGIAIATGDVIYFLNADDTLIDDYVIKDISLAFQADCSRTFIFGNVVLVGEPTGFSFASSKAFVTKSITELLHAPYCHQAIFAKRSLFKQVGVFDCKYKFAADYDWIVRAFKFGSGGFFFLDRKIALYFYLGRSRQHDSATRREKISIQSKHLMSVEFLWYYFRYIFVRGVKKRLLNEPI